MQGSGFGRNQGFFSLRSVQRGFGAHSVTCCLNRPTVFCFTGRKAGVANPSHLQQTIRKNGPENFALQRFFFDCLILEDGPIG